MAPKIFLTGVTGYIGGDIFAALYEAHPEYEYTLLVRNQERGKPVAEKYPKVKLAYGSLDSTDILEKEAAAADIVIHAADSADNLPAAKAIAKGVAAGHTAEKPGYWLHISGTGILEWYDDTHRRFGEPPLPDQSYADIADIDRLLSLPDEAGHRDVEKVVQAANDSPGVITAIVAPCTIYGRGRGPVNQRSQQVPAMAEYLLHHGYAPVIGSGKQEWDNVHIVDVSSALVSLVAAVLDPQKNKNAEMFGLKAYYILASGVHTWGQVAKWIAESAYKLGFMGEVKMETMGYDEVMKLGGNPTWGANSKGVTERATKYLGWKAQEGSLEDDIPDTVKFEAERLGIKPTGHTH